MFGIRTEFPIIYSVVCVLLGVFYAYLLYRQHSSLNRSITTLLFFLRTFVVSFLFFLLLNPVTSIIEENQEKPIVVLAQDASISCAHLDDLKDFQDLADELAKEFNVVTYNYADEVNEGFSSKKEGKSTNISKLMDEIDLKFSNRNLLGVVLTSDGLFNNGENPNYHRISKSIPFYTIPIGDTTVLKDVRVSDVLHNEISFLGNVSPIQIQVQTDKCKGQSIHVQLYHGKNLLEDEVVKINTNSDYMKLDFFVDNNLIGLQKYKVFINALDGERSIENNSFTFFIDVLDSRYKILMLSDVSHPDLGAVKSVFDDNDNYEVDLFNTEDFDASFDQYDLVVMFYVSNDNIDLLTSLNESNVPILMFVNSQSHNLLNIFYPAGSISGEIQHQDVTASYNTNFKKFNVSSSLENYVSDLPPLVTIFGDYNFSASSEVLLYQKIGMYNINNPLIVLDDLPEKKISIIYGEGIWRWKLSDRESSEIHQNFSSLFSKIFQYLMINEDKSRFRVFFEKKIDEGEDIVFKAEYYNDNYELNNNKEIKQTITNEDGKKFNFIYSKNNSSYFLNIGKLAAGKYFFTSNYNQGEEQESGEFTVAPKQIETIINTANHQLLFQLSKQSNADVFNSFNIDNIKNVLIESRLNKTIIHSSEILEDIIKKSGVLILLILMLLTEWIVRKYNGFY